VKGEDIEVDETGIANALGQTDLVRLGGHEVPQAEIVMIAELTGEMHEEGPFLDLTETASLDLSQLREVELL
jgi:UbiD family decarboxylase